MTAPKTTSAAHSGRRALFLAASASMFIFGIVLALLGVLFGLPEVRARLKVDLAQQGDLFLLLYSGVLVSSILVGPVIDRRGKKLVLLLSAWLVALALGGFAAAHSFAGAAILAVLLGLGGGGLNIAANALVSDLYGSERGEMLNVLGSFYGVGAVVFPLLAASLPAIFTVGQLLVLAAALTALAAAAYALLRFPLAGGAKSFSLGQLARVARAPGILLLASVLFCESGNEAAVGGWTSSYLGAAGATPNTATWVLTGYWVALMVGRLLAARLLRRIGKAQLVLASGIGAMTGCVALLAAPSLAGMAAGVVLGGLSFAAIYPTTLAIAGDRYPHLAGTVFGLLFSVGVAGGMAFPWAIGHLGQSWGMRRSMLLPVASSAMICLLVLVIRQQDNSAARNSS